VVHSDNAVPPSVGRHARFAKIALGLEYLERRGSATVEGFTLGILQFHCRRGKGIHRSLVLSVPVANTYDKGAIFATLGLTALQIPDMHEAWWFARAFCVVSMVLGVLSVITATRQHFDVVMLKSPLSVRLWLSRGRPRGHDDLPLWTEPEAERRYANVTGIKDLPLESSVMSLKAVAMPRHLLDLSVLAFIIGFGLYELSGFVHPTRHPASPNFTSDPDASSNEEPDEKDLSVLYGPEEAYRNVFIVFSITLTLCLAYWWRILNGVFYESVDKNEEFGTSSYEKGENIRLTELRRELRGVQHKFKLEPPDIPESDEADVVTVLKELKRDLKDRDEQWQEIFPHTLRQARHQLHRTTTP